MIIDERSEKNQRMLGELQDRFNSIPEIEGSRILNGDPDFVRRWGSVFNFNYDGRWNGEVSNLFVERRDRDLDYSIENAIKDGVLRYCHDNGLEVFEDLSGNPAGVVLRRDRYSPTPVTYTTSSHRRTIQISLLGGVGGYSDALSYQEGKVLVRGSPNPNIYWTGFPKNIHDFRCGQELVKPKEGEIVELPRFSSK
ncbi:hypothetical protein HOI26_03120 [Candidatus Woesearchaeota archaeon]|nr:hypothetical protein [Candidatus Woesearchaeota archaeon]MBT5740070.1 hypothetical protein [Candidatus Woesearchaeota archaeon]